MGCGGAKWTANVNYVEGTVTLDGKPLTEAFVQFIPKTQGVGEVAGGHTDGNGMYKLSSLNAASGSGAVVGEYTVTVSKLERTETFPPGADMNVVSPTVTEKELVPAIYTDQAKSPISKTVKAGKNVIDIELSGQ